VGVSPKRISLTDDQYSRALGILEADSPLAIAMVVKHLMQQLAKDKVRMWEEFYRLAGVDRETALLELSHTTKELLVHDRPVDPEVLKRIEDEEASH
jgi:hypothetical protein